LKHPAISFLKTEAVFGGRLEWCGLKEAFQEGEKVTKEEVYHVKILPLPLLEDLTFLGAE